VVSQRAMRKLPETFSQAFISSARWRGLNEDTP
jgi:hypothetical protein